MRSLNGGHIPIQSGPTPSDAVPAIEYLLHWPTDRSLEQHSASGPDWIGMFAVQRAHGSSPGSDR